MEKDLKKLNLKTAMALSFSRMTNLKTENIDVTNNNVIFLTAAGIVCGTYVEDLHSSEDAADILLAATEDLANKFVDPDELSTPIALKDVTLITSSGSKQTFKNLFVFPDDIIAVTIGNYSDIRTDY